jgi:glycosyltransferase involved in cell wall biosynthesis
MSSEPTISVIVPTYNRSASLKRTLNALCLQTYPLRDFEVIVISDGCTDETSAAVRSYDAPFTLHFVEQHNRGASTARNSGAEYAKAPVLLFVDDDVEPMPGLLAAHVRAHHGKQHQVVIGPYPGASVSALDFAGLERRAWWDETFTRMRAPGHRFMFTDLVGGNFSIEKELFAQVGRFDPTFGCHEDSELGMRLIMRTAEFNFAPEASAYHHEERTLARSFDRKREEGGTDVRIARLYPDLLSVLPLGYYRAVTCKFSRILRNLAFTLPQVGDAVASNLKLGLEILEEVRLREEWKRLWDVLKDYWYWRGAAEELINRRALDDLAQLAERSLAADHLEIEIDLREGIDEAERRLDEQRPAALRLLYGTHAVGVVPFIPGAEPLKGIHLRSILTNTLAAPMLAALTLAGVTTDSASIDREKLAFLLQLKSCWFGKMETRKHWSEQYSQWLALDRLHQQGDSLYWRQQTEITNLKNEKLVLDSQYAHWRRLGERQEQDIKRQQEIIDNLDREKKSLERQWQGFQPTLQRGPLQS